MVEEAVILAGGRGTRLRAVVADRPKPLANISGRPFIEWLLRALRLQGVRHVVLSTGHLAETVQATLGDGLSLGVRCSYAVDPFPLGTGGALRNALEHLRTDRIVALNGDSYCRADLRRLYQHHAASGARATIWLLTGQEATRYGSVDIAEDTGEVRGFREKGAAAEGGTINAGVYLLERSLLEQISADTEVSLERDVFPGLVGKGLYGIVGDGPFVDIGTPDSYASAEAVLAADLLTLNHDRLPWGGVRIGDDS